MYTKSPKGLLPFLFIMVRGARPPLHDGRTHGGVGPDIYQHTKDTISVKAQARVSLIITLPLLASPVSCLRHDNIS